MLNTNPAGPEGVGDQGGGWEWGAESSDSLGVSWFLRHLLQVTFCLHSVPQHPYSRAGEASGFWLSIVPWSFPGVLLSSSGRLTRCHKNSATPLQCASSGEPSAWLEEFKVSREPTKDFLQLFSCLACSRNPSCVNC